MVGSRRGLEFSLLLAMNVLFLSDSLDSMNADIDAMFGEIGL